MTEPTQPEQEWRWPPSIVMSPSSLKTYGQCASRIKMQYLQNLQPPDTWVRAFALGNTTHAALGTIAQQLKVGTELIGKEQIRLLCTSRMPLHEYPSDEAREYDIRQVQEWVRIGRAWLETLEVQDWLVVEGNERRPVPLFPARTPYKLVARPDLIVKRLDEDGQPFFQAIDWKTGKVYEEADVPVIWRYVLRDRLREWVGDASAANLQFTWFWLDENYRKDVDLSVEHCNHAWPGILEQMEALATEADWIATPGWYCNYCPFYGNFCPEEMPPAE